MTANEIIEKYGYLVKNVTEQYKLDEDGEAELWLELCERASRSNLPTNIYQYVYRALKHRAETLVSAEQPPILELPEYYDPIEDALDECFRCELSMALGKAMEQLTKLERQVLLMYYCEGMNFRECGEELGLTRERIRQIEAKALRKLRTSRPCKILKPFIHPNKGIHSAPVHPREVWRYCYPTTAVPAGIEKVPTAAGYAKAKKVPTVVGYASDEEVLAYGMSLRLVSLSPNGLYAIAVRGQGINGYLREEELTIVSLENATIYRNNTEPTAVMYQLAWESKRACQI